MKRWTNGSMLAHLRGYRAVGATSEAMGHDRSWLTRALTADPSARLSSKMVADIMAGLEKALKVEVEA